MAVTNSILKSVPVIGISFCLIIVRVAGKVDQSPSAYSGYSSRSAVNSLEFNRQNVITNVEMNVTHKSNTGTTDDDIELETKPGSKSPV